MADFDACMKDEYSTGYAPTIVMMIDGAGQEKFAGSDYGKVEAFLA